MSIDAFNPTTGQLRERYTLLSDTQLEHKVVKAHSAETILKSASVAERTQWLRNAASRLLEQRDRFARLMAEEMGKPLASGISEIEKCALACEYYADEAPQMLADTGIETDAAKSFVRPLPLGVVLAIMPWNYPFWQVFRFAAPALAAGNVVLLKHAQNTFGCARAIERLLHQSGVPETGIQSLEIDTDQTQRLLADQRIRAATLTGSGRAGSAVGETAGRHLKKVVLELGGSDAFIVAPSADVDAAVAAAVRGRLQNSGQSCIAAKRMIVHSSLYDRFVDRLASAFESKVIGNPLDSETDLGPLATCDIRDALERQVESTCKAGASVQRFGALPDLGGWFSQPGILEHIPDDSPAATEELFGPVASLYRYDQFDDALARANATRFGLGSVLFSNDSHEIERALNDIAAGATFVNAITASNPRLPFGGIGDSGHGRELSHHGMYEFMNLKTCWIQ